jgi:hypothetical protein
LLNRSNMIKKIRINLEVTNMKRALCLILVVAALFLGTTLPGYADGGYRGGGGYHGGGGYRGGGGYYHGGGGYYHGGGGYYGGVWVGPGWGAWGPGWGVWGPGWWGVPAYPYVAPPVVIEQPAQIFVEPQQQPETQGYWYYCPDPQGYYPYVNKCPKGWLKVVPTPAPSEKGE